MNSTTHPDLIKVTEIFLVPSSFLVAALGTADSNPHRAGVSVLGLVISILWWVCARDAINELKSTVDGNPEVLAKVRTKVLSALSLIFTAGWLLSTVVHLMLWSKPLGG